MSCSSDQKVVVADTSAVFESAWHDLSRVWSSAYVGSTRGLMEEESKGGRGSEEKEGKEGRVEKMEIVPRVGTRYSHHAMHNDYVKKIKAYAGPSGEDMMIFSVGLDSQLKISAMRPEGGPILPLQVYDTKTSLYSLAVRKKIESWWLVATGGSEGTIKVFDSRQPKKSILKLRGHSEVVKSLLFPEHGHEHTIVSGSADGSIKVWDLRTAKSQKSISIHEDSVWTLSDVPQSFSSHSNSHLQFYSGGRDGSVYWTDVDASETRLLFKEENPILCIAPLLSNRHESLWVSTTDPVITRWALQGGPEDEMSETMGMRKSLTLASSPIASPVATIGMNMQSSVEQVVDVSQEPAVPSLSREQAISKTPKRNSLVEHCVLPCKHRVMTKDNVGRVQVWNVVDLTMESDMGVINEELDFIAKRLSSKRYLPKWFTADTRSGQLTINIEPYPRCLDAIFPNQESIQTKESDSARIYETAVGNAFKRIFRSISNQIPLEDSNHKVSSPRQLVPESSSSTRKEEEIKKSSSSSLDSSSSSSDILDVVVTTSEDGKTLWRSKTSEITLETAMIPSWVKKVLSSPVPRPSNSSLPIDFFFQPSRPGLFKIKNDVYKMHRSFTIAGMVEFVKSRNFQQNHQQIPRESFVVTLDDVELPLEMDLGSIKHFLWKENKPIPLFYSYALPPDADSASPLPQS